jgi:hypothetical protein
VDVTIAILKGMSEYNIRKLRRLLSVLSRNAPKDETYDPLMWKFYENV